MRKGKRRTIKKRDGFRIFPNDRDYMAFRKYCKEKKIKRYDIVHKHDFPKICREIFREVGNLMVEKPGGVLVKKFGYFCVIESSGHTIARDYRSKGVVFNPRPKASILRPSFLYAKGLNELRFWDFGLTFSSALYNRMKEKTEKGFHYTAYPFSLRKLLGFPMEKFQGIPFEYNKRIHHE